MVKRLPVAVAVIVVAWSVGWWLLPVLALVVLVAVATERTIAHLEQRELRATVDSYELASAGLPERMRTLASWGGLRRDDPVPAAPKLRPDQHWAAEPTGGIRRWVLADDRPTLLARTVGAARVWLAAVERHPWWTDLDTPVRLGSGTPGRHRADAAAAVAVPAQPVRDLTPLSMPTGEFDQAVRRLTAEVYATVARSSR